MESKTPRKLEAAFYLLLAGITGTFAVDVIVDGQFDMFGALGPNDVTVLDDVNSRIKTAVLTVWTCIYLGNATRAIKGD